VKSNKSKTDILEVLTETRIEVIESNREQMKDKVNKIKWGIRLLYVGLVFYALFICVVIFV
jgi:hypothetical protein